MGNTASFMGESLKRDTSTRDSSRGEESLAGESYAPDECRSWALPKLMMAAEKMQLADEYEEAEELYQTIATYLEKGSDEMATLQDRMGCLFVRTGRLVEAMKCFRKALSIKKLRSPHSSSVAKTMGNIASVYCGKGEYDKALAILEDCLAIQERKNPGSLRYAKVLGNIAVVCSRCEQYELAIEYHERSFEIKKLQAPGSLSFATTSLNLADLWMTKDLSKAISYLKRAQLIAEAHRPVPYAFLSDVFTVTANILRHTEFYNEAIDMYLKAMILEEAVALDSEKLETLRTELYNAQLESQSSWSSHRNAAKRLTGVGPDNMSSRRYHTLVAIAEDDDPLGNVKTNDTTRNGPLDTENTSAQLSTQESTWVDSPSVGATDGFTSLSSQSFDCLAHRDGLLALPQDPANAVLPGNYPQDHIEDCINYAAASWAVMPSTSGARFDNSIEESVQDASSDAAVVGEPSCPSSTVSEDSAYQNQPQMVPLATPPAPRDLAEDGDLLDMLVYMADKGAYTEYPDFRQTLSMESMNPQISHSLSSRDCVSLPRPVSESDDNSILHVQSSQDNSYASLSPMPYPDGTPEDPLELTLAMAKSFPPHRRNSTGIPTKPNRSRRKLKQKTPASATLSSSSYGAPVQESRFPDESPRHIQQ